MLFLLLRPSYSAVSEPVPAVCSPGGAERGARVGGGGPEAGQPAAGEEPAATKPDPCPDTLPAPGSAED